ncbi:MAG: SRPBCC family protein [Campylobacterota bacterium]
MKLFEKSTLIKCSAEELFDFHLDSNNLKQITPSDIKIKLLTPDFVPKQDAIMKVRSIKNFIPFTWEVKIDKIQRPNKLVDIALKSPFKYWEHQHLFIKHENYTELRDVVKYELPFGFIGGFLDPFIYNDLTKMFDFRHKVTKEILEK